MTLFDILILNREFIARLRSAGGSINDIDYIDLFLDYNKMASSGLKVSYIVSTLSSKYSISQRTIYSVIKRFKNPLQL